AHPAATAPAATPPAGTGSAGPAHASTGAAGAGAAVPAATESGAPGHGQPAPARNPSVTAAIPTIGTVGQWHAHRDIRLDPVTHTVLVAQREVELTPTEFDLLATLLESKRRVRSKADLALVLRGEAFGSASYVGEPDKRAIEAHMANLRRKIGDSTAEPRYIETVRGVGYRLTAHTDGAPSQG
ncbi:winged helix-turn-helix domain-containing protein, partial [Microbacterium sp. 13-71-7]|uniref:winged helix-turn-helix domain-containing protein n=1 Tax=Microbacterium sp. 13-71-7 TaxID=1970399 RepID=UPI0025F67520